MYLTNAERQYFENVLVEIECLEGNDEELIAEDALEVYKAIEILLGNSSKK